MALSQLLTNLHVTRHNVTAIDNILTNEFMNGELKTGIIKSDISDHFPIFLTSKIYVDSQPPNEIKVTKRLINNTTI